MSKSTGATPDEAILSQIITELKRAKKAHPRWPTHVAAQAGIVCEEAGELIRTAVQSKYERKRHPGTTSDQWRAELRKEAIQVAVTAIRFLENLK